MKGSGFPAWSGSPGLGGGFLLKPTPPAAAGIRAWATQSGGPKICATSLQESLPGRCSGPAWDSRAWEELASSIPRQEAELLLWDPGWVRPGWCGLGTGPRRFQLMETWGHPQEGASARPNLSQPGLCVLGELIPLSERGRPHL